MRSESLIASGAINIGLALISLCFFSILKKQPSNAPIYYPLPLSRRQPLPRNRSFRFLPSISWIPTACHVTEDQILLNSGLDALVLIRLFKFGINFFSVCSVVGILILLPLDYYEDETEPTLTYHSMDTFTITNIANGSNKLWVHFLCLWIISFYGLYLLHKEYKAIMNKRIQQLRKLRHQPNQFTILVRQIPLCQEHKARGCSVDHFFSKHHPSTYHSYQILYDVKDLEPYVEQAKDIDKKISKMKHKFMVEKREGQGLSLDASEAKVGVHETNLQQLSHTIRQLQNKDLLKEKELPVAFVSFKSRLGAALAAQSQHHSNPLQYITETAPEPRDVSWENLYIPLCTLPLYKIGVILAGSLLIIFFAIPVTAVQGIAKFEKLRKWFPPARAIELIPGLTSVVTGYLPSAVLNLFMCIGPYAILGLSHFGGSISKSKEEIKACNIVFYFLVGNVFFLSLISGSLLDAIGEYISHPRDIPSHLASAVSAQADFFVTYILTTGLSGFSFEILQLEMLLWDTLKSYTYRWGKETTPYLFSVPYFRAVPTVCLSILIGTVYAVITPLLLPYLIGYFCLGYIVYMNQIQDVYETSYDTCGQYWPFIHHYVIVAIILTQVTMIGIFGLKAKPSAAIATVPLLLITVMFNEYCKICFLPTFQNTPLQTAVEIDELDQKIGEMENHYQNAINDYCQPCLKSLNFAELDSSLTQPLISSQ